MSGAICLCKRHVTVAPGREAVGAAQKLHVCEFRHLDVHSFAG